jgi:hypothetical protein
MPIVTSPVAIAFGEPNDGLCPRTDFEWAVSLTRPDAALELEQWRQLLERGRDGDVAQVMKRDGGVNLADPPEGTSWMRWAQWVESRLEELVQDPTSVVPIPLGQDWRFREGVLDPQAEQVVRRALGSVAPPSGGSRRDHLVIDTGNRVGIHRTRDPDTHEVREEETSHLAVTLERGPAGALRVLGFEPTSADSGVSWTSLHDEWPVLAGALGGWFSQTSLRQWTPWAQQVTMLEEETDDLLSRLVVEGGQALRLGDEELRNAVHAMGSQVEPSFLRHWLEWMFWRIEHFEWK